VHRVNPVVVRTIKKLFLHKIIHPKLHL
jgi:hypothetical protein